MNGLHVLLSSAKAEMQSWTQRTPMIWLLFGAPFIVFALLWALFGAGDMRNLPAALCDLDRSVTSHRLGRWIEGCPSMSVTHMVNSPENGEKLLREGKVYAFILIPKNFERDVLRKRPAHFSAWLDGQNMAAAGLLKRDISDVGTTFWKQQDSEMRGNSGVPRESAQIQSSTVTLDLRPIGNPSTNYLIFLLPGLLPAIIQLAASLASACSLENMLNPLCKNRVWLCGTERNKDGTAPGAMSILGSQAALSLWYAALGMGFSTLLFLNGDLIPHGSILRLIPAWLLMAASSVALGHLIYAIRPTLAEGLSLISVYSSPAFAFAGLTFPLQAMPFLGRYWAMSLPLTHYIDFQAHAVQLGATFTSQLPSLMAMALLALVFSVVGLKLTVRRGALLSAKAQEIRAEGVVA